MNRSQSRSTRLTVQHGKTAGLLGEQHDIGAKHRCAFRACGNRFEVALLIPIGLQTASRVAALREHDVAVQLDDISAAGPLMESIDVLRDDQQLLVRGQRRFPRRQCPMRGIGARGQHRPAHPAEEAPRLLRTIDQRIGMPVRLDLVFFPDTARAWAGLKALAGRYPGAGENDDSRIPGSLETHALGCLHVRATRPHPKIAYGNVVPTASAAALTGSGQLIIPGSCPLAMPIR